MEFRKPKLCKNDIVFVEERKIRDKITLNDMETLNKFYKQIKDAFLSGNILILLDYLVQINSFLNNFSDIEDNVVFFFSDEFIPFILNLLCSTNLLTEKILDLLFNLSSIPVIWNPHLVKNHFLPSIVLLLKSDYSKSSIFLSNNCYKLLIVFGNISSTMNNFKSIIDTIDLSRLLEEEKNMFAAVYCIWCISLHFHENLNLYCVMFEVLSKCFLNDEENLYAYAINSLFNILSSWENAKDITPLTGMLNSSDILDNVIRYFQNNTSSNDLNNKYLDVIFLLIKHSIISPDLTNQIVGQLSFFVHNYDDEIFHKSLSILTFLIKFKCTHEGCLIDVYSFLYNKYDNFKFENKIIISHFLCAIILYYSSGFVNSIFAYFPNSLEIILDEIKYSENTDVTSERALVALHNKLSEEVRVTNFNYNRFTDIVDFVVDKEELSKLFIKT